MPSRGFRTRRRSRASAFREQVAQLSAFNADVRAARIAPAGEKRAKALEVFERHGGKRAIQESVVIELLGLLRDVVGWKETLDYIESLPPSIARHPLVLEQRALALSKSGDPAAAAGRLEELIDDARPHAGAPRPARRPVQGALPERDDGGGPRAGTSSSRSTPTSRGCCST